VDLSKVNPAATELCFVVTIHEAAVRRQNFGQVRNAFVRIYNQDTNEEILKYDLDKTSQLKLLSNSDVFINVAANGNSKLLV